MKSIESRQDDAVEALDELRWTLEGAAEVIEEAADDIFYVRYPAEVEVLSEKVTEELEAVEAKVAALNAALGHLWASLEAQRRIEEDE